MFKEISKNVSKKIRNTLVILCAIPILISAGLTLVDQTMLSKFRVENKVNAANSILEDGQVYTISTIDGLAITTFDNPQSKKLIKAELLNQNDKKQHFVWHVVGNDKNTGIFLLNDTNLKLKPSEVENYKSDEFEIERLKLSNGQNGTVLIKDNWRTFRMPKKGAISVEEGGKDRTIFDPNDSRQKFVFNKVNVKNTSLRFADQSDRVNYKSGYPQEKEIYIITHGFNDKSIFDNEKDIIPNDNIIDYKNRWLTIAKTVKSYKPNAIILILDWSNLAKGKNIQNDLIRASSSINSIAKEVKNKLNKWGLNNGQKVNMIGHSLGTYMSNEIGREFNGINNMILMDPASDLSYKAIYSDRNCMPTNWLPKYKCVNRFDEFSNYSVAFMGRQSIAGNEGLAQTADESYWMSYDDKDMKFADLHEYTNATFIGLNNKNQLYYSKSDKDAVLNFNEYEKSTYDKRSSYRQRDDTYYDYKPHCIITTKLDCSVAKKGVIACGAIGSDCKENNWQQQSWGNHNGIIASKKIATDSVTALNVNIQSNIQNGYVKQFNQNTKKIEKLKLYIK